jgi:hypothetical protein
MTASLNSWIYISIVVDESWTHHLYQLGLSCALFDSGYCAKMFIKTRITPNT